MGDGVRVQAVEFVEGVVEGGVGDEVVDVFCVFRKCGRRAEGFKGGGTRKRVVRGAD